jgi:hypothetical membrane protein
MDFKKIISYTCFLGIASFIITIALSTYYNPWFSIFKNAFSDLGAPSANLPWIYNYGLIVTSIFITLYSIFIILSASNKLEVISGAFFFVAGIFLSLIGIYPAGTRPHVFVSTYFFIQSDIAILSWSLGILNKNRKIGLAFLIIAIVSPLIGFIIEWPSVALQESFGIIIITIWAITVFFIYK